MHTVACMSDLKMAQLYNVDSHNVDIVMSTTHNVETLIMLTTQNVDNQNVDNHNVDNQNVDNQNVDNHNVDNSKCRQFSILIMPNLT